LEALISAPVVHHFDPEAHRIDCGVPGFARSTKHVRSVTCPTCLELLRGSRATLAIEEAAP